MAVRFYVAHGASGSSASMRGHVDGLKRRGIDAIAIDLPVRTAEDVVPTFRTIVPDAPGRGEPPITVGGQSYGGRVATLAAAAEGTDYAGIVCFSYPLHPPGKPEQAEAANEPLAGDPLPGPAPLGRGRPVRPHRAAPGRRPAPPRGRAAHVPEAGPHAQAGARRRPRSRGRVPPRARPVGCLQAGPRWTRWVS